MWIIMMNIVPCIYILILVTPCNFLNKYTNERKYAYYSLFTRNIVIGKEVDVIWTSINVVTTRG